MCPDVNFYVALFWCKLTGVSANTTADHESTPTTHPEFIDDLLFFQRLDDASRSVLSEIKQII